MTAFKEDTTELLARAGFVRKVDFAPVPNVDVTASSNVPQAYSGVFHMLPLGLRVQEKIERLIDKHMQSLGRFFAIDCCELY